MKNLFVKQRVRIVGKWDAPNPPFDPYNMTGVIIEKGSFEGINGNLYKWIVLLNEKNEHVLCNSDELEPVTDSYDLIDSKSFEKFLEDNKYREGIAA